MNARDVYQNINLTGHFAFEVSLETIVSAEIVIEPSNTQ